jgi:hypothetical protein
VDFKLFANEFVNVSISHVVIIVFKCLIIELTTKKVVVPMLLVGDRGPRERERERERERMS